MPPVNMAEVIQYVESHIVTFHQKRLQRVEELKLTKILKRKNPYLFKAKNILTAQDLVKSLVDAHLSSQEETIFGDFLEGLVIFINAMVYGGRKSSSEGIDLEFDKEGVRYIISIKSGPNWGNSSQINKMRENFRRATRVLRTSNSQLNVIAVNGCCYGRNPKSNRGDYFKYCGQEFWQFISGDENLYTEIIKPLGQKAKERNDEFLEAYSRLINNFTLEFSQKFCADGKINWDALVKFNSSANNSNI
jgi:hypothetical protein